MSVIARVLFWNFPVLLVGLFFFSPDCARATHFTLGTLGGLMVQPASQYFLAIYGTYANFASEEYGLQLRASYLERPRYKANGFVDHETGAFYMLGTRAFHAKEANFSISAFAGWGSMRGYDIASKTNVHRSFYLPGLTTLIEAGFFFPSWHFSFSHQTLTGFLGRYQTSAYVAWPYNYFYMQLGWIL